jgi:GT2 family glycosyltransferase/glycosyltransferase involved in cell wall biosynthesis
MKLLLRKLLLLPFYLMTAAIDLVGRYFITRRSPVAAKTVFGPGVSIVIPERVNKEVLLECLRSVWIARAAFAEPVQVIVVASEAVRETYSGLMSQFQAEWILRSESLWFIEAVEIGVRAAKYDWVYLLNTDMVLDSDALREVSKWRSPSVFAIASQIFFQDSSRRREETGLTAARSVGGLLELADVPPADDSCVRLHLYAGGGSSLFRRTVLARFIERTKAYAPFYWEDVEWGVLAWRSGYQVLFCPQSKVWHRHRATNLKFFSAEEIDRIFRRNRLRFQLRTALPPDALRTIFGSIARLDRQSFWEMLYPSAVVDTLRSRFRSCFDPDFRLQPIPGVEVHYGRPRTPGTPLVLLVSPYCVYPPAHGGARRIHELIARLAQDFDIILLSDEPENYSGESFKYFCNCHLVCLVSGRTLPARDTRIDRILAHSHAALAAQLQELVRVHNPDIVQIEYVELSKLVELRDSRPWVLTLHDVLLQEHETGSSREDRFELQYINRFDAVIVCSAEDLSLLSLGNRAHLVQNSANMIRHYRPSPADGPILFIGPFRYPPNLAGIMKFLETAYPAIRVRMPTAELWILGGVDARAIAERHACFQQAGITVFDLIEDVQPCFESCSLSINPDKAVRGSSVKVIESLAAGRVCVSTRDGARGLLASDLPSLVVIDENDFADTIVRLLANAQYRHSLEVPKPALHRYSWQNASEKQAQIYRSLLKSGYSIREYASAPAVTEAL